MSVFISSNGGGSSEAGFGWDEVCSSELMTPKPLTTDSPWKKLEKGRCVRVCELVASEYMDGESETSERVQGRGILKSSLLSLAEAESVDWFRFVVMIYLAVFDERE